MTSKKAFLLRIDPALWSALERLAEGELRSVNAEIEYLLREALRARGIAPGGASTATPEGPSAAGTREARGR